MFGGGRDLTDTVVRELLQRWGGLFNLDNYNDGIGSPLRTRIQSGKAQVQEVLGHAAEDQNQIRTSSR